MTCVSGHLTSMDFGPEVKNWAHPPEQLFDAPVHTSVDQVRFHHSLEIWTLPHILPGQEIHSVKY